MNLLKIRNSLPSWVFLFEASLNHRNPGCESAAAFQKLFLMEIIGLPDIQENAWACPRWIVNSIWKRMPMAVTSFLCGQMPHLCKFVRFNDFLIRECGMCLQTGKLSLCIPTFFWSMLMTSDHQWIKHWLGRKPSSRSYSHNRNHSHWRKPNAKPWPYSDLGDRIPFSGHRFLPLFVPDTFEIYNLSISRSWNLSIVESLNFIDLCASILSLIALRRYKRHVRIWRDWQCLYHFSSHAHSNLRARAKENLENHLINSRKPWSPTNIDSVQTFDESKTLIFPIFAHHIQKYET
jgi:hypothetical protein